MLAEGGFLGGTDWICRVWRKLLLQGRRRNSKFGPFLGSRAIRGSMYSPKCAADVAFAMWTLTITICSRADILATGGKPPTSYMRLCCHDAYIRPRTALNCTFRAAFPRPQQC